MIGGATGWGISVVFGILANDDERSIHLACSGNISQDDW